MTGFKTRQAQSLTHWRAKDNYFQQAQKQSKLSDSVMFELNARLDLSRQATTKSLRLLGTELMLQVLSESTRTVTVRVIRGDEGVRDIPGVRGGSGESADLVQ